MFLGHHRLAYLLTFLCCCSIPVMILNCGNGVHGGLDEICIILLATCAILVDVSLGYCLRLFW